MNVNNIAKAYELLQSLENLKTEKGRVANITAITVFFNNRESREFRTGPQAKALQAAFLQQLTEQENSIKAELTNLGVTSFDPL